MRNLVDQIMNLRYNRFAYGQMCDLCRNDRFIEKIRSGEDIVWMCRFLKKFCYACNTYSMTIRNLSIGDTDLKDRTRFCIVLMDGGNYLGWDRLSDRFFYIKRNTRTQLKFEYITDKETIINNFNDAVEIILRTIDFFNE